MQLISGVSLGLLGIFMYFQKRFKVHPYPSIGLSNILLGFYYCNLPMNYQMCSPQEVKWSHNLKNLLPDLFSLGFKDTMSKWKQAGPTIETIINEVNAQIMRWRFMYVGSLILGCAINIFLLIEIVMILWNPFFNLRKRFPINSLLILILVLVCFFNLNQLEPNAETILCNFTKLVLSVCIGILTLG
jgi:hypothetical protein